jgi:NAD(P)H-hydrate epimerase
VGGSIKDVIGIINRSGKTVISIDIPSGINGLTGAASETCIRADKTVTFALPKTGLAIHPGCEYAGELVVAEIGIPQKAVDKVSINRHLIDPGIAAGLIPGRRQQSNKGDYGKILIVSGSKGMTGAGALAARSALRVGAGLVYLGVPASLAQVYDLLVMESVTLPLEDEGTGALSLKALEQVCGHLSGKDAAAVGPGLSVCSGTADLVRGIVENAEIPLVLDADALNIISQDVTVLGKLKVSAVLTPHPGEMARLMGVSVNEVQSSRLDAALEFAVKWKVVTVLKGSRSIIALPDGTLYVNPTGNSGMATGGTGDVLTGIIAGLLGQGLRPADAAVAGVYLHGLAGDIAASDKGEHGMIAGDVAEALPQALKRLLSSKS